MRAYLSHAIRGNKGNAATEQDMAENNRKAMQFAGILRRRFPQVNFYVPAEHDEFVQLAYLDKYLTEKQILEIDGSIVTMRDFLVAYVTELSMSSGMEYEVSHAANTGVPVFPIIEGEEDIGLRRIEAFINGSRV